MDKLKGVAKNGWKPSGDRPIHRDTWKSDLKGIATGKKQDPYEYAREHTSAPLTSLRDPDTFGPPPRHTGSWGSAGALTPSSPSRPAAPTGGLGSPVPAPRPRQQEQEEAPKPPERYTMNTTGYRTDNLPKPPVKRVEAGGAASPARVASPALPPRQTPPLPMRQAINAAPPPVLPSRMNEYPTESTPLPPPTYGEAIKPPPNSAMINVDVANRLGQAGVSVPGFGIGGQQQKLSPAGPSAPQLSELQQRFSRMNTGSVPQAPSPQTPAAAVASKKPPPPPPPKKTGLTGSRPGTDDGAPTPPPIPMFSKPKPSG